MCHNKCKILLSVVIACLYSVDALSYLQSTQDTIHDKPVTLQNILTTQPEDMSDIMSSGGALTITGSGTIHFLQAFFYSDTGCTTLLGAASAIDNVSGMTFSSGQTVNINSSSVYQLANNQGITTGNIACMKIFLNGSNQSPDGISCQSFTDINCSGTDCVSNQTKSVSWASGPPACQSQYAYFTNFNNNTVSQCAVNSSTGTLSSCSTTGSGFQVPYGISIINGYAFIANAGASTVSKCSVNPSTGALSSCASTGSNFNAPSSATINGPYFYTENFNNSTIEQCSVNASSGALSSCNSTGSGFGAPQAGMSINNGYAYVPNSNGNNTVSICSVSSSTGAFSNCSTTSGFTNPNGVTTSNGYAYVANYDNNTISLCTINSSTGALSGCTTTGSGFSGPNGIGILNGYAYIENYSNSTVSVCAVNSSTGALSGCTTTGSGFSGPSGIGFF